MLNELAAECHQIAVEHGWWETPRNDGEILMLVVTELAEAFEHLRKTGSPAGIWYTADENGGMSKPDGVPIECADVLIRLLEWCHARGIDIDAAMREKMSYNRTRSYRHGGKLA